MIPSRTSPTATTLVVFVTENGMDGTRSMAHILQKAATKSLLKLKRRERIAPSGLYQLIVY